MKLFKAAVLCGFLAVSVGATRDAQAQSPTLQLLQTHLYEGSIAKGEGALAALATKDPANAEAAYGLGAIRFVGAIERFGQALYRHGLKSPKTMLVPLFQMPVPPNPKPEKLTYDGLRAILVTLVQDLDQAQKALEAVGDAPVKLKLDMTKIRLDLDRDGKASDNERFYLMFARVAGQGGGRPVEVPAEMLVGFDTADAFWLRGYANLIASFAEFLLAHDFKPTFESTFHLLFPDAGLPFFIVMGEAKARTATGGFESEAPQIADLIAMIHFVRWPVLEPQRMKSIHGRLKTIIALNRKTWASIRAETDDDFEWLPGPKQKGVLTGFPITDETVDSWLGVLDQLDQMLDGKLMVPHWRFQRGLNLLKVFHEPQQFDLVLWVTGHGALPFLSEGPVGSSEAWQRATMAFQGGFFRYAFYFN